MTNHTDPGILARHTGDTVSPHNRYHPWDIDYLHATRKIHCVEETAAYLYGDYTPREVAYVAGTRPELEVHAEIALKQRGTEAERAKGLTRHVNRVVLRTRYVPEHLHELGGTEERILRRGFGRRVYGRLSALNDVWERDFGSWDAVVPLTREEVHAGGATATPPGRITVISWIARSGSS